MTLPAISILGVGAVTPIGRDLATIAAHLQQPPVSPDAASQVQTPTPSPGTPGEGRNEGSAASADRSTHQPNALPAFSESATPSPQGTSQEPGEGRDATGRAIRVLDDLLTDPALGKRLRRADRFTRMAVLAAADAWTAAQPSLVGVPMERVGLIVASGFGPHGRGFKFLDGLLDFGDSSALPTDFSHSVHGAPAAYITEILGLRGPSLSVTDFVTGVEQAVLLAQCWLEQGVCDRVLVGTAEELGAVLLHCAGRMLNHDQRIVPGEGAVFFLLGPAGATGSLATVAVTPVPSAVGLLLLDQPVIGLPTPPAVSAQSTASFQPYFGHHPSSAAFQLLGALLAMRRGAKPVDNAATFRPSCDPNAATMLLRKS